MSIARLARSLLLPIAGIWATNAVPQQVESKPVYREENKQCTLRVAHAVYSEDMKKNRNSKKAMEAVRSECGMIGGTCSVEEFFELMAKLPSLKELRKECRR